MEIESKLINQGSYGCIYYPSLPFQIQRDKKQHGRNSSTAAANANATDTLRSKYVSKLQKFNFHSDFEDHIGRKIQEIPSYDLFFVPVLKTYKIDLATIKEEHVTGCDAISKYIRRKARSDHTPSDHPTPSDHHLTSKDYKALNKNFIIQKMKYINGKYLHRYLLDVITHTHTHASSTSASTAAAATSSGSDSEASDDDNDRQSLTKTLRKDERQVAKYRRQFKKDDPNGGERPTSYYVLSILFDLYERITDSIQLLIKYKIVHYDLKENNILIEKRHQLPYIIDFGLSIDVSRLQEHPWSEKQEDHSKTTIHSDILYQTQSSKIFQYNYLWRQHFYVHAPDYFLWPIEVHLMTYLINESDTLTQDNLQKICYEYVSNNKAITYMSREFKKNTFEISVATFSRFIDQPREQVLNELLKYWDKWDIYAVNIMFLKTLYEMLFHRTSAADTTSATSADSAASADTADSAASTSTSTSTSTTVSLNEQRQNILDPHYSEKSARFHSKYKVKLKHKYNNRKILNTIQVMLRNIHPNPDKRMTPQETKAFFVSIFYEC
jgi:serine/threonine protein kinase